MNEKELQAYIERINKKLKYYYGDTYKRMLNLPEVQKAIKKGTEDFKFSNYTTHKVDKIVAELTQIINTNLQKGIANAWNYGIDNTTNHLSNAFGRLNEDYETEIDKTVLQATKDIRNKTKESYRIVTEKKGGLNISERVWNYNDQIKKEMEIAIQNGIKQGKSADDIARDMQKYLNNPESLFRRVRDIETDKLSLSKAAKEYHPGQGVYRSAYKNAMRLITTEVNAAYREAEWASYQNNPLIKGYEIRLSNNHTILRNGKRVKFYDICDELQGIYPKTFKWTMWHPQCRCRMIPILISQSEFEARNKARKEGTLDKWKVDEIKDMPDNYKKYINNNKERFDKLKNKPSWLLSENQDMENKINPIFKDATTIYNKETLYRGDIKDKGNVFSDTEISSDYIDRGRVKNKAGFHWFTGEKKYAEMYAKEQLSEKRGEIKTNILTTIETNKVKLLDFTKFTLKDKIEFTKSIIRYGITENMYKEELLFTYKGDYSQESLNKHFGSKINVSVMNSGQVYSDGERGVLFKEWLKVNGFDGYRFKMFRYGDEIGLVNSKMFTVKSRKKI